MLIYKIKFTPDGSVTAFSASQAKRFADGYVGKEVIFRGKKRKVRAARFDTTRGFVLTDTNGKTFLYADIADTAVAHNERPIEPAATPERKAWKAKPERDVADFRVRLERAVVREARELTRHDPDLHISDPLFVAYLARLGLRALRRKASSNGE